MSRQTIITNKTVKMNINNDELQKLCVVGVLRNALTYKTYSAMNAQWVLLFDGEILPEDHQPIPAEKVIKIIETLSVSKQGRPRGITLAAQSLKKVIFEEKELTEKVEDKKDQLPDVLPINENIVETSKKNIELPKNIEKSFWDKYFTFSKLDIVYAFTIGVADYGLIYILKEMGMVAAVVYTLISLDALGMAKNRYQKLTARNGIIAVWILEILAFFIHLTMFNKRLWGSVNDLPFTIDNFSTEERPFYIALTLSFLLSAACIYAVSITLSKVLELNEAENFEQIHNQKY